MTWRVGWVERNAKPIGGRATYDGFRRCAPLPILRRSTDSPLRAPCGWQCRLLCLLQNADREARVRIPVAAWAVGAIATGLAGQPAPAAAQNETYPSRVVRIISDSAAGSASDATARILADKLSAIWGQQ